MNNMKFQTFFFACAAMFALLLSACSDNGSSAEYVSYLSFSASNFFSIEQLRQWTINMHSIAGSRA